MTERSILLRLFFKESSNEGYSLVKRLYDAADDKVLTLYTSGRKYKYRDKELNPALRFNIAEGTMFGPQEIHVRYRPSVASPFWESVHASSPESVASKKDHELFEIFLTLSKFGRPSLSKEMQTSAVIELLCCNVRNTEELPHAIVDTVNKLCPEIVLPSMWGYADSVPFRDLGVKDEWEIAMTDLLWLQPPTPSEAEHQFFISSQSLPQFTLPHQLMKQGGLQIYALPTWE